MSTLDELIARKSVRVYTDEPISAADERAIVSAAYEAPTAGNQQLYSLIAIRDQALKERLAVLCDNQPFIAKAKLVLIFLADLSRWQDAYIAEGIDVREPGLGDVMLSVVDTAIAAQNSVVAAWSLGIGSCYIGDILENYEEFVEILDLPPYAFPAVMVVFGHPTEQQLRRTKPPRFAYDDMLGEDRYLHISGERLEAMMGAKIGVPGRDRNLQAFVDRKWNADFSIELNRSVAAWTKTLHDYYGKPGER